MKEQMASATLADEVTRENAVSDEISLTDILVAIGHHKNIFYRVMLVGGVLSVVAALLWPKSYLASTTVIPPQQQSNSAVTALAQLGALGGVAAGAAGVKSPEDMYLALLKSRALQDSLSRKHKLMERYETSTWEDTRRALSAATALSVEKKSGFITIEVQDKDPKFAAQLANDYVLELRQLMTQLSLTDAQQRRTYFELQVTKTRTQLNDAETRFRDHQATSGLVVSQALAESGVKESALLRGQIAAKEVQLQTLYRFATAAHPDVQRVSAELGALRQQLSGLEQGTGSKAASNLRGTKAVQAFRDMKVQEALLETLIRQLELARADEAKEGPLLQQVDVAVVPEKPSKPRKAFIVIVGGMFSLLLGASLALIKSASGQQNTNWTKLRQAWR